MRMKGKSEIQMLLLLKAWLLAGLPGMKGLYQPMKVDSKAIQEFIAFYHILKQQSPFKCISWRIMQYSGQIPTMLASAFWENRGLN